MYVYVRLALAGNLHKTYPRYMYTQTMAFLTFPVPRIHVCSCICKCVTLGAYVGHMYRTRVGLYTVS